MKLMKLGLDEVKPNPFQPRDKFDEEKIQELADNIKAHGMIEPIVVTPKGDKYMIVAGERRWRASKKAGLETIYAICKEYATDADIKRDSLVENEIRENLSNKEFKEFAESLAKSLGEPYYTKNGGVNPYQLTAYILNGAMVPTQSKKGIVESHSGNSIRSRLWTLLAIEKGVPELRKAYDENKIGQEMARKIASIEDEATQRSLTEMAVAKDHKALEAEIKRHNIRKGYEEYLADVKVKDKVEKSKTSEAQVVNKVLTRLNDWTAQLTGLNEILEEDNRFMFQFSHEGQLMILDGMKPLRKQAEKFMTLNESIMEKISGVKLK
jgi:hypothetical protein